jgi:4a-hydroxytetrahydrobiopterin dehydratase
MGVLNDEQIAGALDALPGWERDGDALACDVECGDFKDAIGFVNRVADLAEAQNHHPDILVHGYKHVRLTLSTHSEGGITENDVALARAIDAL